MPPPQIVRWILHGEVDSTNERALAEIESGRARHGDVHLAEAQTAGRGRFGRRWHGARGESLFLSLVWMPPPPLPPAPALTMAAGLALLDALGACGLAAAAQLDWPNDVVAGGAKLAGCLVESRGFDRSAPHCVIGIGANVRQTSFPHELERERAVTSLARLGLDLAPRELAERLAPALLQRLEQAATAAAELGRDYRAAARLAGARVRVTAGAREHTGRVAEIHPERGLALDDPAGRRTWIPLEHVRALVREDAGSAHL